MAVELRQHAIGGIVSNLLGAAAAAAVQAPPAMQAIEAGRQSAVRVPPQICSSRGLATSIANRYGGQAHSSGRPCRRPSLRAELRKGLRDCYRTADVRGVKPKRTANVTVQYIVPGPGV